MDPWYYLRRALELPPRQTAQRAWALTRRMIRARWQQWRDRRGPTGIPGQGPPGLELLRYCRPLPLESLRPHRQRIAWLALAALEHRFDLLGSGWVEVRHGIQARGREGHRYESAPSIEADSRGDWLEGRIDPHNLPRSIEIWQGVRSGYVPIDWQRDFISGHRWSESTHSTRIRDDVGPGIDIKVPWELARMQHLPQLVWAFALACDGAPGLQPGSTYLREFQDQILDFLASNPPRFGVNWTCSMDVAIRAAGWLLCHDLFAAHGARFDPAFEKAFLRGIHEHGLHLIGNLEWSDTFRGNHYLANLAGLVFVSAYQRGSDVVDDWLAFAVAELVRELELQFGPDGGNIEASTSYHRLSAEMVAFATAVVLALPAPRLQALAGRTPRHRPGAPERFLLHEVPGSYPVPFPLAYFRHLRRIAFFTTTITFPSATVPQIGDNDNGRFLKVWPSYLEGEDSYSENHLDHRPLVATLDALVLPGMIAPPDGGVDSALVQGMVPRDRLEAVRSLTGGLGSPGDALPSFAAFPDFGLFTYHTARLTLVVRCGPVGQAGNGGHAHNDQLSFELHLDGHPVVVDPGTYLYTPLVEQRNRFRSTAMHNTLALPGREQNTWYDGRPGLFSMQRIGRSSVLEASPGRFVGEHEGPGVTHRRSLEIHDESLAGQDQCPIAAGKVLHFHLAPVIEVEELTPHQGVVMRGPAGRMRFQSSGGTWGVGPSWYSRGYGSRQETSACTLSFVGERIAWALCIHPS